jgi:hypothetical protein
MSIEQLRSPHASSSRLPLPSAAANNDRLCIPVVAPPIELEHYILEEASVKLEGYELHAIEQWSASIATLLSV